VEDNRNAEFELGDEEPINAAADRFAKLAPKMSTMAMISGNEVDRHLVGAIFEICLQREWRSAGDI
jgi:hypothetical protein